MLGVEPVAAPGVGVVMPVLGVVGLLIAPVLPVLPVLPMDAELPPIGAGEVGSGIGVVTAGAAVLAGGVLGIVVVSSFLPQAAKASTADSARMVTGVR